MGSTNLKRHFAFVVDVESNVQFDLIFTAYSYKIFTVYSYNEFEVF